MLEFLSTLETKTQILKVLSKNFLYNFNINLQLGAELEFYLSKKITLDKLSKLLESLIEEERIIFEKEKGHNQYELKLPPISEPHILAQKIVFIKNNMTKQLSLEHIDTIFLAKPYDDQVGSALHIHLSLWRDKHNILEKYYDQESDNMLYAIGGICELMLDSMIFFAPTENCYKRFIKNCDAPTKVSWGGNNRTTAVRIPYNTPRRIEHRISSSSSDPYLVLIAILMAVYYGLENKVLPPKRIYGNASDNKYALPPLPQNLLQSSNLFKNSQIMKYWLDKLIN
ncbi:MAG: glutamine synthetase [Rickettsiales endosymbiont of Dermacentor nuttalli]